MAKGYWIVRVDITDQEKYKSYIAANAEPLKKYGARFLVRGGPFENPEGTSRTRNAVIEFLPIRRPSIAGSRPNTNKQSSFGSLCRPSISSSSRGTKGRSRLDGHAASTWRASALSPDWLLR
jgi:Domain of unknown function (DUF1330)